MIIKNETELQKILDGNIIIPIYWHDDEDRVYIDEDGIRDEFENKLREIIKAVENY